MNATVGDVGDKVTALLYEIFLYNGISLKTRARLIIPIFFFLFGALIGIINIIKLQKHYKL